MDTIGSRIRVARQKALLTQHELGTRIGVRESQITRWERDVSMPRIDHLLRIAQCLGVGVVALCGQPPVAKAAR